MASSTTAHPTVNRYGCSSGRLGVRGTAAGLPNSCRQDCTSALSGFGPGGRLVQVLDMERSIQAFVLGFVQAELADRAAQQATGMTEQEWRQRMAPYVTALIATGKYPYLDRIVRDAEDFPDPDELFERRLGYVLDGLAAGLGLT
jgi:Tetracyclin repressor-like, C-terminal domain